jgi:hypothetical protein
LLACVAGSGAFSATAPKELFVLKSNELGKGTTKSSALWKFKKFNLWQVSQDYTKAWKCPLKTIYFRPLKVK